MLKCIAIGDELMAKDQEKIIQRNQNMTTVHQRYCTQVISKILRDIHKHTRDEAFIKAFNEVMTEKFPNQSTDYNQMIAEIKMQDDAEFVKRIRNITAVDPVRANFEMSLYIRRMEDDFDRFTPKKNIKNI